MKCKCGHMREEHNDDDDLSCCCALLVTGGVMPFKGYLTDEMCPCMGFIPDHMAVEKVERPVHQVQ